MKHGRMNHLRREMSNSIISAKIDTAFFVMEINATGKLLINQSVAGIKTDNPSFAGLYLIDAPECTAPDITVFVFRQPANHIIGQSVFGGKTSESFLLPAPCVQSVIGSHPDVSVTVFQQRITYVAIHNRIPLYLNIAVVSGVITAYSFIIANPDKVF